jgi:prolycopene isomerase
VKFGGAGGGIGSKNGRGVRAAATAETAPTAVPGDAVKDGTKEYDAIVIGSGIGGLVAATQLAIRGARVILLEKYIIPGGSSGYFQREGYTFDVGSSVMFGFSEKGSINLVTKSLAAVGRTLELIEDPVTVHYHLPNALSVPVHREYAKFLGELISRFPHEEVGIRTFYKEAWRVYNALNALELKSLEEPRYLFGQFFRNPVACLTLAYYLPQNAGDIARKYIKDPDLLSFIDTECFLVSTVDACRTPMINASMVMCDRHFGGINYPRGGVGRIAQELADGLVEYGGEVQYKANVTQILMKDGKAVGVQLSTGNTLYAKTVISNATRWDTFEKLMKAEDMPQEEKNFQKLYRKSPSFLSIHMGVKAEVLPPGTECHHLVLEDEWSKLEDPYQTIFMSIPTVLDSSLAPPGRHILHIFTTAWIDDWQGLSPADYEAKKEAVADKIVSRLEATLFPGLKEATTFREVGTPKTHRRYLARDDGTYGPIPAGKPKGLLGMPFNTTAVDGLYCVGDSCFPGQGVIAVAFSGTMCAHRVAADLGFEKRNAILDKGLSSLLAWFRTLA